MAADRVDQSLFSIFSGLEHAILLVLIIVSNPYIIVRRVQPLNLPYIARFVSTNSLWWKSGKRVYNRRHLLKLSIMGKLGRERYDKYLTSHSGLWLIFLVGILLFLVGYGGRGLLPVVNLSEGEVQTSWSVLASLISVSFIVIIFILQFIENEYYDREVTQTFVRGTWVMPVVYVSLLSLGAVGTIVYFAPHTEQEYSVFHSLIVITATGSALVGISLVYFNIARKIFVDPLDTSLQSRVKDTINKQLLAEIHQELAQKRLEDLKLHRDSPTVGGDSRLSDDYPQEVDGFIMRDSDFTESKTIFNTQAQPEVEKVPIEGLEEGYIADVNETALKKELDPIPPTHDHLVMDLSSPNSSSNDNLCVAGYRSASDLVAPNLQKVVLFSEQNLWKPSTEDPLEEFRAIVAESVEDGNISSLSSYVEFLDDITREVIQDRRALIDEHKLHDGETSDIGDDLAKCISETFERTFLKVSELKDADTSAEVHDTVEAQFFNSLRGEYHQLSIQLLIAVREYFGSHRSDAHKRSMIKVCESLPDMYQYAIRHQESRHSQDPIQNGIWIHASETVFDCLSYAIRNEQMIYFETLWKKLFSETRSNISGKITRRVHVPPIFPYLTIGLTYSLWSSSHISTKFASDAIEKILRHKDVEMDEADDLFTLTRKYNTGYNDVVDITADSTAMMPGRDDIDNDQLYQVLNVLSFTMIGNFRLQSGDVESVEERLLDMDDESLGEIHSVLSDTNYPRQEQIPDPLEIQEFEQLIAEILPPTLGSSVEDREEPIEQEHTEHPDDSDNIPYYQ